MPNNVKILGDDPVWKREVDKEFARLNEIIRILQSQIKYLQGRLK